MPRLSREDSAKIRTRLATLADRTERLHEYRDRVEQGRTHALPCRDLTCTWHHEIAK